MVLGPITNLNCVGAGVLCSRVDFTGTITVGGAGAATHNLLSATHPDTVAASPIRGDLIRANGTPAWERLAIGADRTYLVSDGVDPSWGTLFLEDAENEGTTTTVLHGNAAGAVFFDPVNLSTDVSGVLLTGKGGTGLTTVGTANQLLSMDDSGTGLEYVTIQGTASEINVALSGAVITIGLVDPVAINKGGTGQITALAAFNALSPLTTQGDMLTHDGVDNIRVGIGADATYWRSDGSDPSWQTIAYADISGTPTSLPPSGAAGGDLTGTYPNPTVADADLIAIRDLVATAGMLSRTGAGAFVARTLTPGSTKISISNGTGAAGDPTFDVVEANLTLSNLGGAVTDAQVPNTITLDNITQITTRSHASLQDLTAPADDHTQYLLLAGRTGTTNNPTLSTSADGTITGSTASGGDLYALSTSHSTKGALRWNDQQIWWEDIPDLTAGSAITRGPAVFDATVTLSAAASGQDKVLAAVVATPTLTMSGGGLSGGTSTFTGIHIAPSISGGVSVGYSGIHMRGTVTSTSSGFSAGFVLDHGTTYNSSTASNPPYGILALYNIPSFTFSGTGTANHATILGPGNTAVFDRPTFTNSSTGTFNSGVATVLQEVSLVESSGTLALAAIRGLHIKPYLVSGTPAVTEHVAVDVENISQATLTTGLSLRSLGSAVQMRHAGSAVFGIGTIAPAAMLHVQEQTPGNEVAKIETVTSGNDVNYRFFQNRVAITGGGAPVAGTVATITTATDQVYQLEARHVCICTGGSACTVGSMISTVRGAGYKNVAGVLTEVEEQDAYAGVFNGGGAGDDLATTFDFAVSGTNILVRAITAINETITCHVTVTSQNMGS